MHSKKVVKGLRALHPGQDNCHRCQHQGPQLGHHRLQLSDAQFPPRETIVRSHVWREDFSLPFPLDLETLKDRTGNHNHHDLQRRQVYLGPSHYTVSERCSPSCYLWRELGAPTWDARSPPSTCVRERSAQAHHGKEVADEILTSKLKRHSDCGSKRERYNNELPHPLDSGPMLAKVKSQEYYRKAPNVLQEHRLDCVSETYHQNTHLPELEYKNKHKFGYNEQCEKRHVTFKGYDDGHSIEINGPASPIKNHCNGATAFFSTEVPQRNYNYFKTTGPKLPVSGVIVGETKLAQAVRSEVARSRRNHRKNQGTVREQIKQVVTELEDVLSGLKQVQMEMKEVVQQIDVLTSNIDLGEEAQEPFNGLPQESTHYANHAEFPERDSAHAGVRIQSTCSLSDYSMTAVISACPDNHPASEIHTNPSSNAHGLMTVESADSSQMSHTSALELQKTKNTANGDCLRARPPKAKVKELQHPKGKTDPTKNPDPPPLAQISLVKTKRPPKWTSQRTLKEFKCPEDTSLSWKTETAYIHNGVKVWNRGRSTALMRTTHSHTDTLRT
ncbi:hypothetical protein Baya_10709 [Bagarius yarrelli]|uniref:Protein Largen n=1 Tax=Bagarius yarrelli TaxID=175774 RepID=A0A556UG87_BAGYA|nr:hypothetical protein Baya_10709 [Bagarius yarrelli]